MRALDSLLMSLNVTIEPFEGADLSVYSPVDGKKLANLACDNMQQVDQKIAHSAQAFAQWRLVPAPKRGELVRLLGNQLREHKEALSELVTLECGKIIEEARGEVQEMIDICDFAVGLSRQLYGLTIASERHQHVMQESWHPLGVVGVISAFNFPVAVWAWNAAIALVCGNAVLWKPSEKTPLTALVCQALFARACKAYDGHIPDALLQVIVGDREVGEQLVRDTRVALVSATGSTAMGQQVAPVVIERFGKLILELGGNNAVIITSSADLDIAIPATLFGAIGTAGQRCTTTRRAFVHRACYEQVLERLCKGYASVLQHGLIGSPFDSTTLVGPLIDEDAYMCMQSVLVQAQQEGGNIEAGGERVVVQGCEQAVYVQPALVTMPAQTLSVMKETFAPILYVMLYDDLEEVMLLHNAVEQGLSSAIFTTDIREAEYFKQMSDCGIANVNIGTSGAEIGGAFGGEKATGGGRESGSDAWKQYMRRQTSTTYYGKEKPELAQGIRFAIE